jgi:hypothetical protein
MNHAHEWSLVAVEEDNFGLVQMLQCPCGAVEYRCSPPSF